MPKAKWWFIVLSCIPIVAQAAMQTEHSDPIAAILLAVSFIIFFALIGRYLARCLHQPTVLGELMMGVFIGNLFYYFGFLS